MSEFMLAGSDPRLLLSHVALAGLGAILEEAGARVLLGWRGGMGSKPVLDVDGWSANEIGAAVRAHAQRATHGWPTETLTDAKGKARGLMSPRLASLAMPDGWRALENGRRRVADTASALDLRLLGALGRPAYWRAARDGRPAQDEGASRWEMQPRNQGSEFVGTRLLPLARAVATRTDEAVIAGLTGDQPVDELGGGRADSRTATGLAAPGPVDNAVAWCALWGLSQFPLALRVRDVAASTGHIGRMGDWFHTLTWRGRWRPARARTMFAARAGWIVARRHVLTTPDATVAADALADDGARRWLAARGVTAVVCFPVSRHGSDSAPERRAGLADVVRLSPS